MNATQLPSGNFEIHNQTPKSMIKTALQFIKSELEKFMRLRGGDSYSSVSDLVLLTGLVKRDGSLQTDPANIYMTLTHLEEERLENKQPVYQHARNGGRIQVFQPPVRLNAYVLFSGVNDDYPTALRDLSWVATFFQHYNAFRSAQYPNLNESVPYPQINPTQLLSEITAQLYTITYEQQSYIYSSLGAKYTPSLLYKFRLLIVFDQETEQEAAPILEGASRENPI